MWLVCLFFSCVREMRLLRKFPCLRLGRKIKASLHPSVRVILSSHGETLPHACWPLPWRPTDPQPARSQARGLSRELSQQKNVKKTQAGNKGNQEGLTATQRAERDAKVLQEKAAAKAASKAAALAEGGAAAEKVGSPVPLAAAAPRLHARLSRCL